MDKTLFWVGAGIVGYWLLTRENGFALGSLTNSMGFGGNPNDQTLSQQESTNWWGKFLQGTPATATINARLPSDTPAQIKARIDAGVFGL